MICVDCGDEEFLEQLRLETWRTHTTWGYLSGNKRIILKLVILETPVAAGDWFKLIWVNDLGKFVRRAMNLRVL